MTTVVNSIIANYINSSSYGVIINGVSMIVLGMLIILVIEKVLIDAYEGKPREQNTIAFTTVILPLLFVMMIVILLRVAQVLHL